MSVTHPDDVILQRNRYRIELASVRLEVTSLRNANDRLESEKVDLLTHIKDLQKQIASTGGQQREEPTPPAARVIVLDDSDNDKDAILSTLPTKSMNDHIALKSGSNPTKRRRSGPGLDTLEYPDGSLSTTKRLKVQDNRREPLTTDQVSSGQHAVHPSSSGLASSRLIQPTDGGAEADPNSSVGTSSHERADGLPSRPSSSTILPATGNEFKTYDEQSFSLPPERIAHHLNGCPILAISPPPLPAAASRASLLLFYRTNTQNFIAKVNYKGTPRAAVFAQPGQNPFLPPHPGARGLLFASRHEVLSEIHMLFVKLEPRTKGTPAWEYRGDYESTLSAKMTPAEFKIQKYDVKVNWALHILDLVKWDCYTSMRARIYLRKIGQLPTDEKAQNEAIDKEVDRIRNKCGGSLSVDDMIQALTRGDEGIDIITMKCVKYDHEFAQDLRDRSSVGTSQKGTTISGVSIPRASKSTSAAVGGQESGSHVGFDGAPGGSSMGLRRSTRQRN